MVKFKERLIALPIGFISRFIDQWYECTFNLALNIFKKPKLNTLLSKNIYAPHQHTYKKIKLKKKMTKGRLD